MIDKKKIIIMSKLAAYDKYYAESDRKKAEYFRHDYIYRRNISIRFTSLIGSLILVLFYFIHRIVIDNLDILDITGEVSFDLIKAGIFVILVQIFYSMIGFLIFSGEYNEAQDRINDYFNNLSRLQKRTYILERRVKKRKDSSVAKEELEKGYESNDKYDSGD